jgi:hypothetical protein
MDGNGVEDDVEKPVRFCQTGNCGNARKSGGLPAEDSIISSRTSRHVARCSAAKATAAPRSSTGGAWRCGSGHIPASLQKLEYYKLEILPGKDETNAPGRVARHPVSQGLKAASHARLPRPGEWRLHHLEPSRMATIW